MTPDIERRRVLWTVSVLSVGVAAVLLRVHAFGTVALDGDSLFSLRLVRLPLSETIALVRRDLVHPPLHYLVLKGSIVVFGDNPVGHVWPTMVAGALTPVLLSVWMRRLGASRAAALTAGVLLAVAELQLAHAHRVRAYPLYALLVFVAVATVALAAQGRTRTGWWALFSGSALLAVLTHYVAVFYLLASVAFVAAAPDRTRFLKKWFAHLLPAGLAMVGWGLFVFPAYLERGGLEANLGWITPPGLDTVVWVLARMQGVPTFENAVTVSLGLGLLIVAPCVAAFAYAVFLERADTPRREDFVLRLLVWAPALVPIFLLYVAHGWLGIPVWGERHLIPSQPFWIAGLVAALFVGARKLDPRFRPWIVGIAILALLGLQVGGNPAVSGREREPAFDDMAVRIAGRVPASEPVFTVWDHTLGKPLNHYLRLTDIRVSYVEPVPDSLPVRFWLVRRPAVGRDAPLLARLQRCGWAVTSSTALGGLPGESFEVRLLRFDRAAGASEETSRRAGATCPVGVGSFSFRSAWSAPDGYRAHR